MIATLKRSPSSDQGTFGVLSFGKSTMYTTELPWRDNARRVSCIPPGVYRCALVQSPKFGRVYHVRAVPDRSHVLIHSGNFGGDTNQGWTTQLHGCIAPCERFGLLRNNSGAMQAAGLVSRPALNRFMSWANGLPFTLEVS